MKTPLILPEHWKYTELLEARFGYTYVAARDSELGYNEAFIVQWAFDDGTGSNIQENYRGQCNKHRIMYKVKGDTYEPMPDDIETMQQAVDYLYVLLRMES